MHDLYKALKLFLYYKNKLILILFLKNKIYTTKINIKIILILFLKNKLNIHIIYIKHNRK
jgi:hypothetical protein